MRTVSDATTGQIESAPSLAAQSSSIGTPATRPGEDLASLQRAWDNVFAALDHIEAYKLTALEAMRSTVRELGQDRETR